MHRMCAPIADVAGGMGWHIEVIAGIDVLIGAAQSIMIDNPASSMRYERRITAAAADRPVSGTFRPR